jgi:predicted nucleic acid-binding protein
MSDVCIDTDVASLLQKGTAPQWIVPELIGQRVWTSFVTVGELWKWAEVRNWGSSAQARLERWLRRVGVLPYDDDVAKTWGRLAAHAQQRGRSRPQNDTWIAACCVRYDVALLTLNTKDFDDFATHDGLVLVRPPR